VGELVYCIDPSLLTPGRRCNGRYQQDPVETARGQGAQSLCVWPSDPRGLAAVGMTFLPFLKTGEQEQGHPGAKG